MTRWHEDDSEVKTEQALRCPEAVWLSPKHLAIAGELRDLWVNSSPDSFGADLGPCWTNDASGMKGGYWLASS